MCPPATGLGENIVFDGQHYRIDIDKDAVPLNPWNFPMEKFANLLNKKGKPLPLFKNIFLYKWN